MKRNVGDFDRAVRILIGLLLVASAFLSPYRWMAAAGIFLIAVGVIRFCPFYVPLGVNTFRREEEYLCCSWE